MTGLLVILVVLGCAVVAAGWWRAQQRLTRQVRRRQWRAGLQADWNAAVSRDAARRD